MPRTLCLPRSSFDRDEDMILRRTEDGAEKCALRAFRREEEITSVKGPKCQLVLLARMRALGGNYPLTSPSGAVQAIHPIVHSKTSMKLPPQLSRDSDSNNTNMRRPWERDLEEVA